MDHLSQPTARQTTLLRRGLLLEYATSGWNVVGVVIVTIAALSAHSVALAGFGLDSLIDGVIDEKEIEVR
jgi:hypothetical protein